MAKKGLDTMLDMPTNLTTPRRFMLTTLRRYCLTTPLLHS